MPEIDTKDFMTLCSVGNNLVFISEPFKTCPGTGRFVNFEFHRVGLCRRVGCGEKEREEAIETKYQAINNRTFNSYY